MIKRLLTILAMAICLTTMLQAQTVESFVTGLLQQYPEAQLLDIYKSSFQDYMGAEHLVGDIESARDYLEQELSTTTSVDLQDWYYEPCGVEGRYVRISLKAVIDGKVTPEALLDAFVRSANGSERPSVEQWTDRWHQMIAVIDSMSLDLPHYEEDKQFIEKVLAMGKYAISHSPEYRNAYSPHYRIVRRDIFDKELKPLIAGE